MLRMSHVIRLTWGPLCGKVRQSEGASAFPQQGLQQFGNVRRGFDPELGLGEVQTDLHTKIPGEQAAQGVLVGGVISRENRGGGAGGLA